MRDEPQRWKPRKPLIVGVRKLTPTYGERRGRQIWEYLPNLFACPPYQLYLLLLTPDSGPRGGERGLRTAPGAGTPGRGADGDRRRSSPCCGADMRIVAFITEAAPVERILTHIGEPSRPPPIAPARGPPGWDDAPEPLPDWDVFRQPEPDFEPDRATCHSTTRPDAGTPGRRQNEQPAPWLLGGRRVQGPGLESRSTTAGPPHDANDSGTAWTRHFVGVALHRGSAGDRSNGGADSRRLVSRFWTIETGTCATADQPR